MKILTNHDRRCPCKGTGWVAVPAYDGGDLARCDNPQDYDKLCDECGDVYVDPDRWSTEEWVDPEVAKFCDRCTLEDMAMTLADMRRKW